MQDNKSGDPAGTESNGAATMLQSSAVADGTEVSTYTHTDKQLSTIVNWATDGLLL